MTHNEEAILFYRELGLAIAQWAAVENALAQLTTLCLIDAKDRWMLYMGFYSIENFRSKLQFTHTLIVDKFKDSAALAEWPDLVKRLKSDSAQRNKLVHRVVVDYPFGKKLGRRFALVPAPKPDVLDTRSAVNQHEKPPADSLCLRDINGMRTEFFAVYVNLVNFSARIRGLDEPLPKSLEQAKGPHTIQSLRNQMHELLGHPPKPSRRKS
jgi:hypothetical protein